ncbi:MAG: acyltransferase [Hyphomonadaceae bacterium]
MPGAAHTANNFNLLRLVFALMVVAYHTALSVPGASSLAEQGFSIGAMIGVQGFFVLSGYLVLASFERSESIALYAEKRFRRLYPAYAVVILVCALAALVVSPIARGDLPGVGRYIGWNLVFANFMEPNLPGIFVDSSLTEVNGALWTLKIEVMFYLVLPVIAWVLRLAGRFSWLVCLVIYVGAEAWRIGLTQAGQYELARQLPGQMSYFITGMMLYQIQLTGSRLWVAGLVGAALVIVSLVWPLVEPARAIGLGLLAIWVATGWPRLPDAARFGDLSYGLYIVHFPIIQTVAVLGLFAFNPSLGVAVALGSSLVAALLLWHLVEKPALRGDSAYRR